MSVGKMSNNNFVHKDGDTSNRHKDLKFIYKGIDISDDVGLCTCNNCIGHILKEVDKALKKGDKAK